MIEPFRRVLDELEDAFRRLEVQVQPPVKVSHKDGFALRYQEKTPQQALLQKFARYVSGLYAIDLLANHGFCQEQGVIQRTLDDLEEDILFLALGLGGQWTGRHDEYLSYFWHEGSGAGMVKRDKIRAHVLSGLDDPSTAIAAGRDIFKAYSGYVHANHIAVIDMCAGDPPRYQLAGMLDNPLHADHIDDEWNYFYRGLVAACSMAKAFGDDVLSAERTDARRAFEARFRDRIFPF